MDDSATATVSPRSLRRVAIELARVWSGDANGMFSFGGGVLPARWARRDGMVAELQGCLVWWVRCKGGGRS